MQIDGSHHAWLEERGPRFALLLAVDDATGSAVHALFRPAEDARGYFLLLEEIIRRHGIPLAIYSDRHGVFKASPDGRRGLKVQDRLVSVRMRTFSPPESNLCARWCAFVRVASQSGGQEVAGSDPVLPDYPLEPKAAAGDPAPALVVPFQLWRGVRSASMAKRLAPHARVPTPHAPACPGSRTSSPWSSIARGQTGDAAPRRRGQR